MQGDRRRLLHILSTFAIGGPQIRLSQIIRGLGPGYAHDIVPLDGNALAARLLPEKASWQLHEPPTTSGGLWHRIGLARDVMKSLKPDAVCTYNWGAIEWAMADRIQPIARHFHFEDGFGPDESGDVQLARRVWFRRLALGGRTQVIVPSQTLLRLARDRWRLSKRRLHHINNGIDVARFAPERRPAVQPAFARREGEVVIISVGGLRTEKNFPLLIRAFASARAALNGVTLRLVLVGDGPERGKIERITGQLGLSDSVTLTGSLNNPEAALLHADIFAISSMTEQMPISLIEAMACGLPVAATNVGDIPTMLPHSGRDFVIASGDANGLADRLGRLAGDAALRQALGQENRRRVITEYDERTMIARYAALFHGAAA